MKSKYINDNVANGLNIDWKKVYKLYFGIIKKIVKDNNLQEESFYIPNPPMDNARYFFDMSERSVGKTSCYLLLGLIIYKMYGVKFEYIRMSKDGIMPKNAKDLFKVINKFNYIGELFDSKWNTVVSSPRCWYLANVDENGIVLEKDTQEVCHMHCLETKQVDSEKSVYNSDAVLIIVDEFIPVDGVTTEQQYINLMQLHSTIRRQRYDVKCVLLANTVNKYTHFFKEFMISEDVVKMKMGEEKIVKSARGVPVWVHLIKMTNEKISEQRIHNNLSFYGFGNPKLNSIIGGEEWETKNYPHISEYLQNDEKRAKMNGFVYFCYQGKYLAWELWQAENLGVYAFVRPYYEQPKNDAIIYTLEVPKKRNEVFGIGSGNNLDRLIVNLLNNKRTFYAHNECGALFDAYFHELKLTQKPI